MLHLTYLRRDGVLIQRDVPAAAAASALDLARQEAVFFWLDMDVPLPEEGALLADYFHFHKLEIEDALEDRHHPKLEELDDHLFLIVHGVIPGLSLAEFRTREMDIFLATNYLVTHHRQPSVSIQMTRQACPEMLTYLERGPAYLLYQILDRLMELYNPVLDAFGEEIGQLEDVIFQDPSPAVLPRLFDLKRSVLELRRIATHQRDLFARLARHAAPPLGPETALYYRDIYDHLVRIVDHAENDRDTLLGAMEAYLSQTSNKLNEIMKVLAAFGALAVPLTVLTSFFGMNFKHLPALDQPLGPWVVTGLMLSLSAGLLLYFRKRRWI